MSEYNIQMNKYNALNAEYDQLYPQPMKHANAHAKDGSDPITPASIGAYTKTETDTLLAKKLSTDLGYIGGDFSNLDNVRDPGDYIWLDEKAEIGFAGALYTVRVAAPKYGGVHESVTQMMHRTYPVAGWSIKARSYYYASGWTPWRTLATDTDLDTKVSKSGDTMTGELTISKDGNQIYFKGKEGSIFQDWNTTALFSFNNKDGAVQSGYRGFCLRSKAYLDDALYALVYESEAGIFNILHNGNAQTLGFPKIAIGSYVGTGTSDAYGGTQQNSLTFDFEPKVLAVVADGSNMFFPGFLIVRGQTYSDGIGSFSGGSVGFALHITWSGNTVSWWSSNSIDIGTKYPQMNVENKTYRYVALG